MLGAAFGPLNSRGMATQRTRGIERSARAGTPPRQTHSQHRPETLCRHPDYRSTCVRFHFRSRLLTCQSKAAWRVHRSAGDWDGGAKTAPTAADAARGFRADDARRAQRRSAHYFAISRASRREVRVYLRPRTSTNSATSIYRRPSDRRSMKFGGRGLLAGAFRARIRDRTLPLTPGTRL